MQRTMVKILTVIFLIVCLIATQAATLRQNTAKTIKVGLFRDFADSKTVLTDNNTFDVNDVVCELVRDNGTSEVLTLTKTGGVHNLNLSGRGMATFTFDVNDVNTTGNLRFCFTNAENEGVSTDVIYPFYEDFTVFPTKIYDSLYAGTQNLVVDVNEPNFVNPAIDAYEAILNSVHPQE